MEDVEVLDNANSALASSAMADSAPTLSCVGGSGQWVPR